jgi:drug/metabolite transporter (DMT)-like permease
MNWIILALLGPIFWSIGNHIDKFLIEKYFKVNGTGILLIFSSLIGIVVAPLFFLIKPEVLEISYFNMGIVLVSGMLGAVVLWLYFKALEDDEVSVVVPFMQLIPVFAYVLGYFILGETLTTVQILAMACIIFGASVLSFEIDEENKFRLRKKTILFMTTGALISAFDSVIFKYVLLEENFWISTFWAYIGLSIFGLGIFLFSSKSRNGFIHAWKTNSKKIIGINFLNEFLTVIGNVSFTFAYLMAPVALVLLFNAYQPVFVLLIGIFLTLFFPKLGTEKIKVKHLLQKIFVIGIMLIGTYFLFI